MDAGAEPRLAAALLERVGLPGATNTGVLLEVRDSAGRTDLELVGSDHLVVVEAKRGWLLPTVEQLGLYAGRVAAMPRGCLLTLSDCSAEWAALNLPVEVAGVPVRHLAWSQVRADLADALRASGGHERVWLGQLETYLKGALHVTEVDSAETFCVSVSNAKPGNGGPRTFRQFVDEGVYFYPFGWGHGWPPVPPNFVALRWDSHVQRVSRVLSAEVVPSLQHLWPDIPVVEDDTARPHLVCRLGPALRMARCRRG